MARTYRIAAAHSCSPAASAIATIYDSKQRSLNGTIQELNARTKTP